MLAAAWVTGIFGFLSALVALVGKNPAAAATGLLLMSVPFVTALTSRRKEGGEISVVGDRIMLKVSSGAYLDVPLADIEDAYAGASTLTLRLENGREIQASLSGVPSTFLAEAGLLADKRRLVAPLRGTLGAFTRGFVAFFLSLIVAFPMGALLGFRSDPLWGFALGLATLFTVLFTKRFGWPRVVIGADGIRLLGQWRQRYISFGEILKAKEHLMLDGPAIALQLRSGEALFLPTIAQGADQRAALVERVNAGVEAFAARESKSLVALERSGRSWPEWRDALRRLAQGEASFREQAVGREDLERVLADPRSSTERRVGAALALRELGPEARERVRVAAAATVDERVRIALDAAAEEELDEGKLEETLRARS